MSENCPCTHSRFRQEASAEWYGDHYADKYVCVDCGKPIFEKFERTEFVDEHGDPVEVDGSKLR